MQLRPSRVAQVSDIYAFQHFRKEWNYLKIIFPRYLLLQNKPACKEILLFLIKSIKSEKVGCLGYVLDEILSPRHWFPVFAMYSVNGLHGPAL